MNRSPSRIRFLPERSLRNPWRGRTGWCRLGVVTCSAIVGIGLSVPCARAEEDEEEVQELREQLTEREDEIRVEKPYVIHIFRRPLSILGQYELSLDALDPIAAGDTTNNFRRLFLEQELEVEAFYYIGPSLSLYLQGRPAQEEDLEDDVPDAVSDTYFERGEMWIYLENIGGLPVHLDVGRLDFEDDRLWWWDEELDAARVEVEMDEFDVALAIAQELAPTRSDRSYIEPDEEAVLRWVVESSWDWSENHVLQFFLLAHDDHSRTERAGDLVRDSREDESDAELLWLGARAAGALELGERGLLGYWVDAGRLEGDERLVETGSGEEDEENGEEAPPPPPGRSVVEEVADRDIEAWALDVGGTWLMPYACDPRLTLAYALGSGDDKPDDTREEAYRQTGLEGNEPGFGGVQRFKGYGRLLDPELSNLSIITAGLGCSILDSSSLDFVCHHYRLVERAESLRDAELDAELTGASRDLGQGIDAILALEEWDRFEFEITASAFRAGEAFGRDEDEWIWGGFAAARVAF